MLRLSAVSLGVLPRISRSIHLYSTQRHLQLLFDEIRVVDVERSLAGFLCAPNFEDIVIAIVYGDFSGRERRILEVVAFDDDVVLISRGVLAVG